MILEGLRTHSAPLGLRITNVTGYNANLNYIHLEFSLDSFNNNLFEIILNHFVIFVRMLRLPSG